MPADAPRISPDALARVLDAYPALGTGATILRNGLSLNTAACVFRTADGTFFAKRYDPLKRPLAGIEDEHRIIRALLAKGYRTPRLYANRSGETLTWEAEAPYAIFALARGEDRYHDVSVFAPFASLEDARSAGEWLARFHRALTDFPLPPPKPFRGITARFQWPLAPSRELGLAALLDEAPLLRPYLESNGTLGTYVEQRRQVLAPLAADLPIGVIHGDFIKRNLFFEGPSVSDVLDFDLWNVGPLVYDLALALLPCGFDWQALAQGAEPRYGEVLAMLEGYQSVRPLSTPERAALPTVMECARVEFYLSLVAMSIEQQDEKGGSLFEGLITKMVTWFEDHVDWSARLREGGTAGGRGGVIDRRL